MTTQNESQIFGPTYEDVDENPYLVPPGDYTIEITEGELKVSAEPIEELGGRHRHAIMCDAKIITGGDGEQNGKRCSTYLALEGKRAFAIKHACAQAGLSDIHTSFDRKAVNYIGDDERPSFRDDSEESTWKKIADFYLYGALVDDQDKTFRAEAGQGLIGSVLCVRIGKVDVSGPIERTGWVNILKP